VPLVLPMTSEEERREQKRRSANKRRAEQRAAQSFRRGAAPANCPCPSCVRLRASGLLNERDVGQVNDEYDAPTNIVLSSGTAKFQIRAVAREFDRTSVRCPWHHVVLLVGQKCPNCTFVRLPTTAEDFVDYIEPNLK